MKGKLKRFLFEEDNIYDDLVNANMNEETYINNTPEVTVNISNVSSISDIYKAANMGDLSKSVYKVKEINGVLPNTMPTSTKKESVLGMMQISGVSVEEVVDDYNKRSSALHSALNSFTNETVHIIESNAKEIELLEEEINKRKEDINSRKLEQEQQEKIINDELEQIRSIVEFIK